MISYKPLFKTLVDKGLKKADLKVRLNISSRTLAKFTHGHPVSLTLLESICKELDCQIQDVVEFLPENTD